MTQIKRTRHLRNGHERALPAPNGTAAVYTLFADRYVAYADGDVANDLFHFGPQRPFGWIDRGVWQEVAGRLEELSVPDKDQFKVLDVGCGPGTWSRCLARAFGPRVKHLDITGVDVAEGQLKNARDLLACTGVATMDHVTIRLLQRDVCRGLDYRDGEFDLTLCLNTVLNHLDPEQMRFAIREMMRVTRGIHITTIRGKWGLPTAYVGDLDQFHVEQDGNVLRGQDREGRRFQLPSYLYDCRQIHEAFAEVAEVVDCYGLDFLVSKVLSKYTTQGRPPAGAAFECGLQQLEEAHRRDWRFLDLANHIVIVAHPLAKGGPA